MSDGGPLRYGALAAFVVYATFSVIVTVVLTANRDKLFIRERGFAYVGLPFLFFMFCFSLTFFFCRSFFLPLSLFTSLQRWPSQTR